MHSIVQMFLNIQMFGITRTKHLDSNKMFLVIYKPPTTLVLLTAINTACREKLCKKFNINTKGNQGGGVWYQ